MEVRDNIIKILVLLEYEFWESYLRKRLDYFENSLTENALFITSFDLMSKQELIRGLKHNNSQLISYNLSNQRIFFLCPHFVSITSEIDVRAARNNRDESFSAYSTTLYKKDQGKWKIFFHQETLK